MSYPTDKTGAIARKLNILASAIIRVEEWATVLFVVIKGKGARFVSKSVVKFTKVLWKLTSSTRRQEGKKWVARITGENFDVSRNQRFGYEFIEPASVEWGKCGMRNATFELATVGYYKDSDGDFFKVFVDSLGELDSEICSYQEVAANAL